MKESLQQFRKEAAKLEETEALRRARAKFESIESETTSAFDSMKQSLKESESLNKTKRVTQEALKSTLDSIDRVTSSVSETEAAKKIADVIRAELDDDRIYRKPERLRRRKDLVSSPIQVNTSESRVDLHPESRWSQSWAEFKARSPLFERLTSWRESESVVARAAALLSDKVSSLFSQSDLSLVLSEVIKVDPTFEKESFLLFMEKEVIPNVLEAIAQSDLDILQDWMHEACFNLVAQPIKAAAAQGHCITFRILDVSSTEIAFGKVMDQGPVLVVTFMVQQSTPVLRDIKSGKLLEASPRDDDVIRVNHVWVVCRDQNELDPKAAWKVLEMMSSS
jgi:import inner membrane translocase subunit TIM44